MTDFLAAVNLTAHQLTIFLVIPALAGLFIYLMEVWISGRLMTAFGEKAIWLTALTGTPVHEFAHAAACVLFRCRIKEIKWLTFDPDSHVLGYVTYQHQPMNPFHWIGRLVIGFAPLLVGFTIIGILFYLLPASATTDKWWMVPVEKTLSLVTGLAAWTWWQWLLAWVLLGIVVHMAPSFQDLKGIWAGLIFLIVLLILINWAGQIWTFSLPTGRSWVPFIIQITGFGVLISAGYALVITLLTAPIIRIRTGHW